MNLYEKGARLIGDTLPAALDFKYDDFPARVMLCAIGAQESRFATRVQYHGPARGYWQFERAGVRGVLQYPTTKQEAQRLAVRRHVKPNVFAIHTALASDDVLGVGFARLLLWTDPAPLPDPRTPFDEFDPDVTKVAWEYYLRNWRPGKPRPESWETHYRNSFYATTY